uniref:Transmembrane protein n=1 Tax=Glossina brevipalpis TaxID=37001 RepID=A0A1A9WPL2_9MUSC
MFLADDFVYFDGNLRHQQRQLAHMLHYKKRNLKILNTFEAFVLSVDQNRNSKGSSSSFSLLSTVLVLGWLSVCLLVDLSTNQGIGGHQYVVAVVVAVVVVNVGLAINFTCRSQSRSHGIHWYCCCCNCLIAATVAALFRSHLCSECCFQVLFGNGVTVSADDVSVSVAVSAVIKSSIVVVSVVVWAGINSTGSTFDFFTTLYGSFSCPGINSLLSTFGVVVIISTELDSKFVVFMLTLRIQSAFFLYLPPISASFSTNIEGRVVISSTSKFKEKPSLLTCTCSVVRDELNGFCNSRFSVGKAKLSVLSGVELNGTIKEVCISDRLLASLRSSCLVSFCSIVSVVGLSKSCLLLINLCDVDGAPSSSSVKS